MWKRKNRTGSFCLIFGITLWAFSANWSATLLLRGLEAQYTIPDTIDGDVIVLLGGGIIDAVPDMSGTGTPSDVMLARMVSAVRLHHRLKLPIIVTGGKLAADRPAEAHIVKRFLIDLGIGKPSIIIEDRARDTRENALFTQQICIRHGFTKPILVTSAYHMRRSLLSFKRAGLDPIPFPAGFKTGTNRTLGWRDYLPSAAGLKWVSTAMHEYIGLLYYYLFY